jgi:CheY-like chemotaxis protein
MKILLIDDEVRESREFKRGYYMWYYVNALEKAGHEVVVANTTDRAIEWLEANDGSVDCILLDIIMPPGTEFAYHPEMRQGVNTGELLARKLVQDYETIPVVVLTHFATDEMQENLKKLANVKCLIDKHECTPLKLAERLATELGKI